MKRISLIAVLVLLKLQAYPQQQYVKLQKKLDGSCYISTGNKLYFTLDNEYSVTGLNYAVYDYKRITYPSLPITSTTMNNGDNRYTLTVTTLPTTAFYVLEVTNQKKEKLYLRFKR